MSGRAIAEWNLARTLTSRLRRGAETSEGTVALLAMLPRSDVLKTIQQWPSPHTEKNRAIVFKIGPFGFSALRVERKAPGRI